MTRRQEWLAANRFYVDQEGTLRALRGYKKGRTRVRSGDVVGWGAGTQYVSLAGQKVPVATVIEYLKGAE